MSAEQTVAPHSLTRTEGVVNPPVRLSAEPSKPCPRCNGTGTFTDCNRSRWRCAYCWGTGRVTLDEKRSVA